MTESDGKPLTGAQRMARLRARRAAGVAADGGPVVRSAGELVLPAVEASLAALGLGAADAAAAQLARRHAAALDRAPDQAWAMRWIAPELLRVLAELGATPAARSRRGEKPGPPVPSALEALRAARAGRRPAGL